MNNSFALKNVSLCGQGITDEEFNESLENLKVLHKTGMEKIDDTILGIFANKS